MTMMAGTCDPKCSDKMLELMKEIIQFTVTSAGYRTIVHRAKEHKMEGAQAFRRRWGKEIEERGQRIAEMMRELDEKCGSGSVAEPLIKELRLSFGDRTFPRKKA
jgi:hypothetical protein